MNKEALRKHMLELERARITQAEENYNKISNSTGLDGDSTIDLDDMSHAHETEQISGAYEIQIQEHTENLEKIMNLSFQPKSKVEAGAVVKVNNRYFIIGFHIPKFEFEGQQYMGISTDAPIFQAMQGMPAGESFELNNNKMQIQEIY
jgi:hypothetical protein